MCRYVSVQADTSRFACGYVSIYALCVDIRRYACRDIRRFACRYKPIQLSIQPKPISLRVRLCASVSTSVWVVILHVYMCLCGSSCVGGGVGVCILYTQVLTYSLVLLTHVQCRMCIPRVYLACLSCPHRCIFARTSHLCTHLASMHTPGIYAHTSHLCTHLACMHTPTMYAHTYDVHTSHACVCIARTHPYMTCLVHT